MQLRFKCLLAACLVLGSAAGCEITLGGDKDAKSKKAKKKKKEEIGSDGPKDFKSGRGIPEADNYIADNGFRPAKNGFLWPNGDRDDATGKRLRYPQTSKGHLDGDGVQRLFGSERVCLGDAGCKLTPGAKQFIARVNRSMNGGQCEGLAVFSLSLFKGHDKPSSFRDDAKLGSDLKRNDIRGPVGYYFSFQFLEPFRSHIFGTMERTTPSAVLDEVISALKSDDPVALEFLQPGVGGHAVVPYAVEDRGNDVYWIRIWDNNYPKASRYIEIDKAKNTWAYAGASINPNETAGRWGGSAARNTIVATRVSRRLYDAKCPFCRDTDSRMIMTAGGRALITDGSGNRMGFVGGKYVNEIPGGEVRPVFAYVPGQPPPDPVFVVPNDVEVKVSIESFDDEVAGIGVFGAGATFAIDDIGSGSKDTLGLTAGSFGFTYEPGSGKRKPTVSMAVDGTDNDYLLSLSDLEAESGKAMGFVLDIDALALNVTEDGAALGGYEMVVTRVDPQGAEKSFKRDDVPAGKGLTASSGIKFGEL